MDERIADDAPNRDQQAEEGEGASEEKQEEDLIHSRSNEEILDPMPDAGNVERAGERVSPNNSNEKLGMGAAKAPTSKFFDQAPGTQKGQSLNQEPCGRGNEEEIIDPRLDAGDVVRDGERVAPNNPTTKMGMGAERACTLKFFGPTPGAEKGQGTEKKQAKDDLLVDEAISLFIPPDPYAGATTLREPQAKENLLVDEAISLFIPRDPDAGANTQPEPQVQGIPGAISVPGPNISSSPQTEEEEIPDVERHFSQQKSAPFEPEDPIQATLVRSTAFVEAQPMDYHSPEPSEVQIKDILQNRRLCIMLAVGMCVIILSAVALIVAFVVSPRSDPPSSADDDSAAPLQPFTDELDEDLIRDINLDPSSPSAKANEWMLSHPNLEEYSVERQLARYSLTAMYFGLNGDEWNRKDHWLDYNVHECDWYTSHPESICNEEGQVVILNLSNNACSGTLGSRPGRYLPLVHTLDYANNSIAEIPPLLTDHIVTVTHLDFSNNLLQGRIVAVLGWKNAKMRVVRVANNDLTGDVSQVFDLVPNAVEIDLSGNHFEFSGVLPRNNSYLEVLKLADNQIAGSLPPELGNLAALKVFNISGNPQINGTIPTAVGMLPLEVFDVSNTSLTGSIPQGLCSAQSLDIVADCEELQCC